MHPLFVLAISAAMVINSTGARITRPVEITPKAQETVIVVTATIRPCNPEPQLSDYADNEGTAAEKWADYGLDHSYWENDPNKCN